MASINFESYLDMIPTVLASPNRFVWSSYDEEADVLYINFTPGRPEKPNQATDSVMSDDDIIIRYDGDEIIGLTILHASQRAA